MKKLAFLGLILATGVLVAIRYVNFVGTQSNRSTEFIVKASKIEDLFLSVLDDVSRSSPSIFLSSDSLFPLSSSILDQPQFEASKRFYDEEMGRSSAWIVSIESPSEARGVRRLPIDDRIYVTCGSRKALLIARFSFGEKKSHAVIVAVSDLSGRDYRFFGGSPTPLFLQELVQWDGLGDQIEEWLSKHLTEYSGPPENRSRLERTKRQQWFREAIAQAVAGNS